MSSKYIHSFSYTANQKIKIKKLISRDKIMYFVQVAYIIKYYRSLISVFLNNITSNLSKPCLLCITFIKYSLNKLFSYHTHSLIIQSTLFSKHLSHLANTCDYVRNYVRPHGVTNIILDFKEYIIMQRQ